MIILFCILCYFICGILAVYLAGVVDGHNSIKESNDELTTAFILGPLSLLIALLIGFNILFTNFLNKIYNKGYNEKV